MKDEEYLFYSDARDKKRTGWGATKRNRTGKGAVRFPSDYLTKKEKNAMNGDVVVTNMNKPMTWDEFRKLKDDLKVEYLQKLRARWDVTNDMVAEMLGCSTHTIWVLSKKLNIPAGQRGKRKPDREGFAAWVRGEDRIGTAAAEEEQERVKEVVEAALCEPEKEPVRKHRVLSGTFTAETTPQDLALLLKLVFGDSVRKYTVVAE